MVGDIILLVLWVVIGLGTLCCNEISKLSYLSVWMVLVFKYLADIVTR